MIKSPLSYVGSKRLALKHIIPQIPAFEEYREPFVGGGSVFIYLKQAYSNKSFWINDLSTDVYCFWKSAQENPNLLTLYIHEIKDNYPDGRQLYNYLKENIQSFDDIKRGAAFFAIDKMSYRGNILRGFGVDNFNHRFTNASIERVKNLSLLLTNVKITNLDYKDVIKANGTDVFIYLDPPYYLKTNFYQKNIVFNHEELRDVLKDTEHKWLLSYNDCEYIRNLYSFACVKSFSFNHPSSREGIGHQLLISNYELKEEQN